MAVMMISGYIDMDKLAAEIERVKLKLGPEVVRLRYSVGPDSTDDPSIYVRIVLTDSASRDECLGEVTEGIVTMFFDELRPYENWGTHLYFSFRSQSEQTKLDGLEPEWT